MLIEKVQVWKIDLMTRCSDGVPTSIRIQSTFMVFCLEECPSAHGSRDEFSCFRGDV
jgi:hypothetical protein